MRIVSLLPSATEIVYALGLGEQLVGVTHECDYPPDALTKPQLTRSAIEAKPRDGETKAKAIDREVRASVHAAHSLYGIDAQMLSDLQPDLIVTQELCDVCAVSAGLLQRTLAEVSSPATVIALEPMSLDGVFETIRQVGKATGTDERAREVVTTLKRRLELLASAKRKANRPRTFVLEWTDPPFACGHWTPELVEIAGGAPVLCFPNQSSRTVSWDDVIEADPECIIVAPCGMGIEATESAIADLDATSEGWRRLRSSKRRHVAVVDGNQFVNRPGPRLVETAELFAAAIGRTAELRFA
jgi:iron complex transport system substrate-binding protein